MKLIIQILQKNSKNFQEKLLNQTYDLELFLKTYCLATAYNQTTDPKIQDKISLITTYQTGIIQEALKKYGKKPEQNITEWDNNIQEHIKKRKMQLLPLIKNMITQAYPEIHKATKTTEEIKDTDEEQLRGNYDGKTIIGVLEPAYVR